MLGRPGLAGAGGRTSMLLRVLAVSVAAVAASVSVGQRPRRSSISASRVWMPMV